MSPGGAKPLTSPTQVVVHADAQQAEVFVDEELLVLDALDDTEDAPGHVVVDRRDLPGAPDEADDRERAVRLGVQGVAR